MKTLFVLLVLTIFSSQLKAQTFTGSGLPIAQNTWNNAIDITIPVSGLSTLAAGSNELIQVNIELDNGTSNISTSVAYELISPSGTHIVIKPSGYNGPGSIKHFDLKIRDYPGLMKITNIPGALAEPFSTGYYRTETASDFANVLTENPNGNWTMRFTETSSFTEPAIVKVELVFGYIEIDDITGTTTNDACVNPKEFCDGKAIYYNNTGFTGQPTSDPAVGGSNPCPWNLSKDNTGWFAWTASSTTAHIEISGLSTNQQIFAFENTTGNHTCIESDYQVVSGGCPTDAVNYNPTYSNGDSHNMELNISGLTIGETYYLVIDGDGGSESNAYLTMVGADNCNTLPIELVYFDGHAEKSGNYIEWQTKTETNNDFFTLERSTNGLNWELIAIIPGAGNSNTTLDYEYTDSKYNSNLNYYRLKQTDYDGHFSFSEIISIQNDIPDNYNIAYSKDGETITITGAHVTSISIINLSGAVVKTVYNNDNSSNTVINVSELPSGIYNIIIKQREKISYTKLYI